MAKESCLLGFDIGTTAAKGALFDHRGRQIAFHRAAYPTTRPAEGQVEQDPMDWIAALDQIAAAVTADIDPRTIRAAAICSQVNTHVFVDNAGAPLMPAIVWQDGRAAAEAARLDGAVSPQERQTWWGAPLPIDASHALARMAWVAGKRPEVWRDTAWVLSPKDFCTFHLTGAVASDPISSIGLVDLEGRYIPALIDRVAGAGERLPPLRRFTDQLGPMALAGLGGAAPPVVVGTMDAWANLFGSGVHEPGQGIYVSGTSEIIGLVSHQRRPVDGIVSFLPIDGRHVHAGPTQCGGDALRWFAAAMERGIEDILERAGQAKGDSGGVVFLPHMMGERAPVWDPAVRGGFVGLGGQTGLAQLSLAVLEGVAFSARWLFEAASLAAGRDYPVLIHSGKGSQSDLWCQIRADVLGVTLDRVRQQDTGVVGAAMLAGVSAGQFASWAQASTVMVQTERRFAPDPRRHDAYARRYEFYRQTYDALAPLYHAREA